MNEAIPVEILAAAYSRELDERNARSLSSSRAVAEALRTLYPKVNEVLPRGRNKTPTRIKVDLLIAHFLKRHPGAGLTRIVRGLFFFDEPTVAHALRRLQESKVIQKTSFGYQVA